MPIRARNYIKTCAFSIVITIFALFLIEGISSSILILRYIAKAPIIAERAHTKYDELLGWVNIPGLYIKDMYGKGIDLRTNLNGFRNDKDFSINVPSGKLRVICSGDSFTLGWGVDNDQTWPNLLASKDEHMETVNMGQGGYGIDQMYLWYIRDGRKFGHDIHIVAFITDDIYRMKSKYFIGYGKPVLRSEGEEIVTENIPVPKQRYYMPRLTTAMQIIMEESKSCYLLRKIIYDIRRRDKLFSGSLFDVQSRRILLKVFESLNRINAEKNSSLVVVYLPKQEDCSGSASDEPRRYLSVELAKRGILFIDLIDEIRKLPPDRIDELFIEYNGHYSIRGNEYIADILYGKLFSFPEIADMFSRIR